MRNRRLLGPIIAAVAIITLAAAAVASIAHRPDPVTTLRQLPPPATPRGYQPEASPGGCR